MLSIAGLAAGYHGGLVLQGLDLDLAEGTVTALLGRNGMGKTTLMRTIMGLVPATRGRIVFDGAELGGLPAYEIANLGIGYVPQGRHIFAGFTVAENLAMGVLGKAPGRRAVPDTLLDWFPVLRERLEQPAGTLSGGEQQQLAIARALAGRPRLLLLDEPSEGIQPSIVRHVAATMRAIAERDGLTVLAAEQNVDMVSEMAGNCAFIENGRIAQRVPAQRLRDDGSLLHRYLSV